MTNAYSTYRQPLYVLTDASYGALGAIAILPTGRYVAHDSRGNILADRKTGEDAIRAAKAKGYTVVSSAWYGVTA